jgi:hypothetical protein
MFRIGDYIQSNKSGILASIIEKDHKNKTYTIVCGKDHPGKLLFSKAELERNWSLCETNDSLIKYVKIPECDCGIKATFGSIGLKSHSSWCSLINAL